MDVMEPSPSTVWKPGAEVQLRWTVDERVDRAQAEESGHAHLDEWIERAELFENEVIAFGHFSSRYSAKQVREILERRLPANLRERVHPLLTRFP